MEEKTTKRICSDGPVRQVTVLPNNWWGFLESKKPRHAGCYCKDKLKAAMQEVGIANNFLQLPEYDVAIALKVLDKMEAKEFDDMCDGFGNTNCSVLITELQLCIAALEFYTVEQMVEMINIKLAHRKHKPCA